MFRIFIVAAIGTKLVIDYLTLIKVDQIMKKSEQMEAHLNELNELTNNVAEDLQTLKTSIESGSVTDAQMARLGQHVQTMRGIAADTENPVPQVPDTTTGGGETGGSTDVEVGGGDTGTGSGTDTGSGSDAGTGSGSETGSDETLPLSPDAQESNNG